MTPQQRVDRILEKAVWRDLSSRERDYFLPGIRDRWVLTEKQEAWLREIEKRVFEDEEAE